MTMLSPDQIKAARAMMGWSQENLAKAAGVSTATVYNLESSNKSVKSSDAVRRAFLHERIEFIGTNGVMRRTDNIRTIIGPDSCDRFFEDVLSSATENPPGICGIFRTADEFARCLGETPESGLKRIEQLCRSNIIKCLLSDAAHSSLMIPRVQFRAISRHPLAPLSAFMYGDKYASIVFKNMADVLMFIMPEKEIVITGRNEFHDHWEDAFPLSMATGAAKLLGQANSGDEICKTA